MRGAVKRESGSVAQGVARKQDGAQDRAMALAPAEAVWRAAVEPLALAPALDLVLEAALEALAVEQGWAWVRAWEVDPEEEQAGAEQD